MKQTKVYHAKTLFSGKVIGKDPNVKLVGVPGAQNFESKSNYAKEKNFKVEHDGKFMTIKNWHDNEGIRTFDDMQGRGNYKLAYFTWRPEEAIDEPVPLYKAYANMPPHIREEIRQKLGLSI